MYSIPNAMQYSPHGTIKSMGEDGSNYIHVVDEYDFQELNSRLFYTMEQYIHSGNALQHPFYNLWHCWHDRGYHHQQTWPQVQQSLQIQTMQDYIGCVNICPLIYDVYDVLWTTHGIEY
jgi:hypothetical protein